MDTDNNTLSSNDLVVKTMLNKNKFYLPQDFNYSAKQRVIATAWLAEELHSITSNNYDDVVVEIDYSDAFCLLYEISFLHVKLLNMKKVVDEMQDKMHVSQTSEKKFRKDLDELTDKHVMLLAKYEELLEIQGAATVVQNNVEQQDPQQIVESRIKDVFYKADSRFSEYLSEYFGGFDIDDTGQNPF